ncbi:9290_t:CDS:2, partial [Paraglomus occultum]
ISVDIWKERKMDGYQLSSCIGFIMGLVVMVYLHNTFRIIFTYTRTSCNMRVARIQKIVLNIVGLVTVLFAFALTMFPKDKVSNDSCKALIYLHALGDFMFDGALAVFILWRVREVERSIRDLSIGLGLISLRSILNIVYISLLWPTVLYDPSSSSSICLPESGNRPLVNLAVNCQEKGDELENGGKKEKNSISLSWNLVRVIVALFWIAVNIWNIGHDSTENNKNKIASASLMAIAQISVSYAITICISIPPLHPISLDSFFSYQQSTSKTKRCSTPPPPQESIITPLPYNQSVGMSTEYPRSTVIEQIDVDKLAVVSMKHLSFGEIINDMLSWRSKGKKKDMLESADKDKDTTSSQTATTDYDSDSNGAETSTSGEKSGIYVTTTTLTLNARASQMSRLEKTFKVTD